MHKRLGSWLPALIILSLACTGDDPVSQSPPPGVPTAAGPGASYGLIVSDFDAPPGERIVVAVRAGATDLLALQGRLYSDPDRLRYLGVMPTPEGMAMGHARSPGEVVWLALDPRRPFDGDAIQMVFEVLAPGYGSSLRLETDVARGMQADLPLGTTGVSAEDSSLRAGSVQRLDAASIARTLGVDLPTDIEGPDRIAAVLLIGDCRQDGQLNVLDALDMARISVGLDPSPSDPVSFNLCDADRNGTINVLDVLDVGRVSVGLPPTNPVVGEEAFFVDGEGGTYERLPVTLTIPQGALAELAVITIAEAVNVPPEPILPGTAFSIEPAATVLDPSATVEFAYDGVALPPNTPESELVIYELSDDVWVEVESVVDPDLDVVTAQIDGLGVFALGPRVTSGNNVEVQITDVSGGGIAPQYEELTPLLYDVRVINRTDSVVRNVALSVEVDADATDVTVDGLTQDGPTWSGVRELQPRETWISRVSLTMEAVANGPHLTSAVAVTPGDTIPGDDSAALQIEVIEDVEPVCGSGSFLGSVRNAEDLAALRRSGSIRAGVFLEASTVTEIDLPCVRELSGFFSVTANPDLRRIHLPAVVDWGRSFVVTDNPSLLEVHAPLLAESNQSAAGVIVTGNDELTTLDLNSVDGANDLVISGASITDLRLDGFTHGQVLLGPLPSLTELNLPNLQALQFNASRFSDLPLLDSLVLPLLSEANQLILQGALPPTISLPALLEGDQISVRQSTGILRISAPLVDSLRLGLSVFSNANLEEIDLPSLRTNGNTTISQNAMLQTVRLPSLEESGFTFTYERNSTAGGLPEYDLELPALQGPDAFMEFDFNGSLRTIRLPNIRDLSDNDRGRITAEGNGALLEVSAPLLESLYSLDFRDNPVLSRLDFPALEEVQFITLPRNASLTTLSLPSLTRVTEQMSLNSASALETLNFPSLIAVERLSIVFADSLETLDAFSGVTSGISSLNVNSNASLRSYDGLLNVGDALGSDPIFANRIRVGNPLICREEALAFRDALENKYSGAMSPWVEVGGPVCPPPIPLPGR